MRPGARATIDLVESFAGEDLIQTAKPPPTSRRIECEAPLDTALEPVSLRIPVGPTYRLALTVPPGHALGALEATLRSADPRRAFDTARARVREGTSPWLRFRPAANFVAGGPPWKLEVQTPDGLWSAAAEVDERAGIAHKTVALAFDARARACRESSSARPAPRSRVNGCGWNATELRSRAPRIGR
jgi:hypothetical protein